MGRVARHDPPAHTAGRLSENNPKNSGALYALAAYGTWGLVPVYWKTLGPVPALELLAHRVVWSLLFLVLLLAARRGLGDVKLALRSKKTLGLLFLTTALVASNWGLFIWAVQQKKLLQASLGYYINPLLNVVLGVALLGERLRRLQVIAVLLALTGVLVLTFSGGVLPWVALTLASTFGLYGLLRKIAAVSALPGLVLETLIVAPLALGYIVWCETSGAGALSQGSTGHDWLLAASGPVTALPLLWFTEAARRLPLSTLGFFQYVAPTLQFLLAVACYGEHVTPAHAVTFALIWAGLVLFTYDARRLVLATQPQG